MSDPKFSVIIPAFNAEKTLRTTVSSVLKQSEPDLEIIIVDDGSTDATLLAMLEVGCQDLRIRAVSQPNSGVSAARNYGASLARGQYLAFLDADDQWHDEKLAEHGKVHTKDIGLDASFAEVAFCAAQTGLLVAGPRASKVDKRDYTLNEVVVENAVCTTSNLVIRRDVFRQIGGFNVDLRYAEDQEFLARLIGQGLRLGGIARPLVRYRMSEDGLSCDFEAMLAGWRTFACNWLEIDDLVRAEATYCRYLARRVLRAGGDMAVARSYVRRGLAAHRPTFMSARSRSLLTICGAYAGGLMPTSMRRAVFA
uniref:glycosyltransferase family 2 protein n=1 Tax=uncultured Erythrobacter sp. TaxID=263913 RepID=UPI00261C444E|nr:glycosyltransferase [uncultured Erythrobacter sp.]